MQQLAANYKGLDPDLKSEIDVYRGYKDGRGRTVMHFGAMGGHRAVCEAVLAQDEGCAACRRCARRDPAHELNMSHPIPRPARATGRTARRRVHSRSQLPPARRLTSSASCSTGARTRPPPPRVESAHYTMQPPAVIQSCCGFCTQRVQA